MSCLIRIDNYYNSLTASEKRIADYIVNDPEAAVKLNINELADAIRCAPSSITKFVRKLDYKSFSDMRLDLMRNVDRSSADSFSELSRWSSTLSDLNQYYIRGISSTLEETLEINEFDKFTAAAQHIAKAENVYLFGVGSSSVVAQDFQQKLIRLNKRSVFCIDGNFGVQNAMLATERDVAFAISYSGTTAEVNRAARRIKENKCPLIAITRYASTALSDMADINLYAPNNEQVMRIASIFSRYSFLFMIDIVYMNFAQQVGHDPVDILKEYRELHMPLPGSY